MKLNKDRDKDKNIYIYIYIYIYICVCGAVDWSCDSECGERGFDPQVETSNS